MSGWTKKSFEDCLENIKYPPKVQRKDYLTEGKFPIVSQEAEFISGYWNDPSIIVSVQRPAVIFGDHTQVLKFVDFDFVLGADGVKILAPKSFLEPKFFYYFLQSSHLPTLGYARHYRLLKNLTVAYPPLPEQRRIVAILDEAFAGLDAMRANAEKNLQNARALFDSYLNAVFSEKGEGWVDTTLAGVSIEFGRGRSRHRPRNDPSLYGGKYPFIQTGDVRNCDHVITESTQTYNEAGLAQSKLWPKGTICITIAANIAETGILGFDACFPDSVIGMVVDERKTSSSYVEFLLQSMKAKLQSLGKGSAQANINLATFENQLFPFPRLETQSEIVDRLASLSEQVRQLETLNTQKLAAIAELKQSILQKAFAGELTAGNVVAFAKHEDEALAANTRTPEFTANVIAYGYRWHSSQNREKTFGRVKAQKYLHLTESVAGVDLGREPMKDAAGPNDFPHMLRAEEWAKAQGFFEFIKRNDGGYDFKKLANYEALIGAAVNTIQPYKDKVQNVLRLLLPMDTQQAEVLATVHAAWNNLILDSNSVSDQAINRAAREDWHSDKLKIPEIKFKEAIQTIRSNGIVPNGTAKRVGGQDRFI